MRSSNMLRIVSGYIAKCSKCMQSGRIPYQSIKVSLTRLKVCMDRSYRVSADRVRHGLNPMHSAKGDEPWIDRNSSGPSMSLGSNI